MHRLAVLHTVSGLVDRFKCLLAERLPKVDSFHMLDESLLQDLLRHGRSTAITRRVVTFTTLAADAGADLILFTCSSTSPAVDAARQLIASPILKIDDPMAERAVELGPRVGLLCTASSTQVASADLVRQHAARLNREALVETLLVEGAFDALSSGDRETHDRLVRQAAADLAAKSDVVVLAQASMAHLAPDLAPNLPVPVLCSPPLCIEALVRHYAKS